MKDWNLLYNVFAQYSVFAQRREWAHSMGELVSNLPPVEEAIGAGDPAVTVGAFPTGERSR